MTFATQPMHGANNFAGVSTRAADRRTRKSPVWSSHGQGLEHLTLLGTPTPVARGRGGVQTSAGLAGVSGGVAGCEVLSAEASPGRCSPCVAGRFRLGNARVQSPLAARLWIRPPGFKARLGRRALSRRPVLCCSRLPVASPCPMALIADKPERFQVFPVGKGYVFRKSSC